MSTRTGLVYGRISYIRETLTGKMDSTSHEQIKEMNNFYASLRAVSLRSSYLERIFEIFCVRIFSKTKELSGNRQDHR
jgi:hypothetical protein